ncbi:MAG TPA: GerMN domain-containing protein [Pyrinomonadaceae bacterium]|jgi:hypothetical protein|nr:GerMN domain-containing protein [Pyrinomonadaceae bacterium]
MKRLLYTLLAFISLMGVERASFGQQIPMAGGYSEASTAAPDVASAARFAVREESRRERAPITLVSIRRAEKQVVAGLNYRLQLRVKRRGRIRDASAVVYKDLRQKYSLSQWDESGNRDASASTVEVKVYLVALDDRGKRGRRIGCGDSLVPVTRAVNATGTPLKTTIEELLSIPQDYPADPQLHNFWLGRNLRVRSALISRGVATIRISGEGPFVAGVCDEPRIEAQIKETARQFPSVRRVNVFVNGHRLEEAIR